MKEAGFGSQNFFDQFDEALTPAQLLRLSKNLAHDWKEQHRSLGFAA